MAAKRANRDDLDRAIKFIEACRQHHDQLMRDVDSRSDAYHGVVKENAIEAGWQSHMFGKYAMHIVDTTLASMVEDKLRYKIRPRMTLEDLQDPEAPKRLREGAEAHQILFDWQNRQSKFTRMQRPFLLQNAIAGITVAKTVWEERVERRRRMVSEDQPLTNDMGDPLVHPVHGPMTFPQLVEKVQHLPVYDGPVTEVIDVHDFFWPENARTMAKARYVAHRIWLSRDELEQEFNENDGMYGPANGGWTWKQVLTDIGTARSYRDEYGPRWGAKKEQTHDKDMLEVIEVWDNFENQVITFVNRKSLIAFKDEFPFFHEKPPFVVCTTQPDLFEIVGISQIEKVQALQSMLWQIQNQSLDNLSFINNAITMYRPDIEDPAALEYAPGAMWPIEDPAQVQMWAPNPMPAEVSLNREGLLKGDMQNLAATFPFSSGAESQTVDQKTATGASIVSGLAQRSIDLAKQPVYDAWEDIGNQRLILNNQFIREPTAATVLGLDGQEQIMTIWPEVLQGDFEFEIEPIPDALMQQQEQAKAQALVQTMGQLAPILLPLAQSGASPMINFEAILEYYFKSLGIEDTKQFFLSKAPDAQLGQQGGQPPPGQQPPTGITGPGSIDPANSPGAQISSSPATNLQRALALGAGGGGRNA